MPVIETSNKAMGKGNRPEWSGVTSAGVFRIRAGDARFDYVAAMEPLEVVTRGSRISGKHLTVSLAGDRSHSWSSNIP